MAGGMARDWLKTMPYSGAMKTHTDGGGGEEEDDVNEEEGGDSDGASK